MVLSWSKFFFLLPLVQFSFAITDDMKQKIVDDHNNARRNVAKGKLGQPMASNMMMMTWDETLASKAQGLADKCTINHDTFSDRKVPNFPIVGQNVCIATDPSTCTRLWLNEMANYQFNTQQCNGVCGHYTQMLWAGTYKIGCGVASCTGASSLVCNYGPGGNEQGADPYIEGFAGAGCPPGATNVDGLCSKPT